ncbi:hypothetical protein [Rhodanobacter lindaniclasticus]
MAAGIDVLVPDPILNTNPAIDAARKRVPASYLKYHVTAMVCRPPADLVAMTAGA